MPSRLQNGSVNANVVQQHVEKILRSGEFSNSEVLRNLLTFLARHAVERPGEVVKEYELAIGVLGRAEGFDPRMDSAVRVHTGRLRAKLAEYYMAEGADDPIVVEVPKGSYQLSWRYRAPEFALATEPIQTPPPLIVEPAAKTSRWDTFLVGFGTAIMLAILLTLVWTAVRPKPIPSVVADFWRPFFAADQPPIVVFSNHRFAGNSATGLHHFRDGIDAPSDANDTYSGTGTVMAVGELSNLFSLAKHSARLKRAELLTWDEARDANVVFVGSPDANARLRELAPLRYFRFKSGYQEPSFGRGGIMNVEPRPGEEQIYFGPEKALTYDYAVIAMLPNVNTERKVMILAGTNTYGCQAAADFIKDASRLQTLATALGVPSTRNMPDFEALIRVDVTGGVPLEPQLVMVRARKASARH